MAYDEKDIEIFCTELMEQIEKCGGEGKMNDEILLELSRRLDELILQYIKYRKQDPA